MKSQANRSAAVEKLVLTALFVAILLVMAFTPLGLIDLPLIKATILHIPVIIGSILLGWKRGGFLGFLFGLTSLMKNTMAPSVLSFAFSPLIPLPGSASGSAWALVVCFVPRILVGIVPALVFTGLKKLLGSGLPARTLGFALGAASGAIVNTGLVMGFMRLVFADAFAAAQNIPVETCGSAILAIVFANGIPEAIAAVVLTTAICLAITARFYRKKGTTT